MDSNQGILMARKKVQSIGVELREINGQLVRVTICKPYNGPKLRKPFLFAFGTVGRGHKAAKWLANDRIM